VRRRKGDGGIAKLKEHESKPKREEHAAGQIWKKENETRKAIGESLVAVGSSANRTATKREN